MNATGVISCVLCAAALACGAPAGEPGDVGTASSADSPAAGANGEKASGAKPSGSFFSCSTNSDCVAVALIENCCSNGWKIAVAQNQVEAYEESTACTFTRPPMCPLYVVQDKRTPACNVTTQSCEMVAANPESPPTAATDL